MYTYAVHESKKNRISKQVRQPLYLFLLSGEFNSMEPLFLLNSAALGAGLSADAFSVSLANGMNEPGMSARRMNTVAAVYAFFQFLMPLFGWLFVRSVAGIFLSFQRLIPWIALSLLLYLGGKTLLGAFLPRPEEADAAEKLSGSELILQGIATSIDALSVGFTSAAYSMGSALLSSLIISAITYLLCSFGIRVGRKFGTALSRGSSVLGGLILILIGLEIFLSASF